MSNLSGKSLANVLLVAVLLIGSAIFLNAYFNKGKQSQTPEKIETVFLSKAAAVHILYGDKEGGGHIYGAKIPCNSEFPKDWDALKVINVIKALAESKNLEWRKEGSGYNVADGYEGQVKIRIVLGPDKKNIITAYPVNLGQNPCFEGANDSESPSGWTTGEAEQPTPSRRAPGAHEKARQLRQKLSRD